MIDRLAVHQLINNKPNIGDRTDFIVVFNELIVRWSRRLCIKPSQWKCIEIDLCISNIYVL